MTRIYLVLAALVAASSAASADVMVPRGGESIAVGGFHGVAFYTEERDGYRVVMTLANGATGTPVRFEATLADRQSLTISVPGKIGERGEALEVARASDKLVLTRPRALLGN
jgi:hypothetical protein